MARRIALGELVLFAIFTALVATGVTRGFDRWAIEVAQALDGGRLVSPSKLIAVFGSAELTLLTALIGSAVLFWRGYGWRSIAPLCFLLIIPFEVASKLIIPQPKVDADLFKPVFSYPFLSVLLPGAYFSGHGARAAFWVGLLLPPLLRGRRWLLAALVSAYGLLAFAGRLVLGEHWPMDVFGGIAFGSAVGLLISGWVWPSVGEILSDDKAAARARDHADADTLIAR